MSALKTAPEQRTKLRQLYKVAPIKGAGPDLLDDIDTLTTQLAVERAKPDFTAKELAPLRAHIAKAICASCEESAACGWCRECPTHGFRKSLPEDSRIARFVIHAIDAALAEVRS